MRTTTEHSTRAHCTASSLNHPLTRTHATTDHDYYLFSHLSCVYVCVHSTMVCMFVSMSSNQGYVRDLTTSVFVVDDDDDDTRPCRSEPVVRSFGGCVGTEAKNFT